MGRSDASIWCRAVFGKRIGVAKTKVGPVARLILETLGIFDCDLKSGKITHEIALATHGLLRAYYRLLCSEISAVHI